MAWTRAELAARVEALHEESQGDAFVEELDRFARESLSESERELLQEVLLQRAAAEEVPRAAERRAREHGWLRRTLRRGEERAERLREARRER